MSDPTKYVTLTNENFEEEVLKSTIPVVVDFWRRGVALVG